MFLPGMLCDERLWEHHISLFEHDFDCSFIDFRKGKNLDDKFDLIHQKMTPDSTLIGFSMGGYIALEYALQFPERIDQLILVGFDPWGYNKARIQQRQRVIERAKSSVVDPMPDNQLEIYLHPNNISYYGKLVQQMARDAGQDVFVHQLESTLYRKNRVNEIRQLDLPVHFIWSENDAIAPPKKLDEIKSNNIDFSIIPESGHMIPLESKEELTNELQQLVASC